VTEARTSSQVSLFGDAGEDLPEPRLPGPPDWQPAERLAEEFKAVGFYLSGHPLDDYMRALRRKDVMTLDEVTAKAERGAFLAKMAGIVAGRQERKSARGNRFAFVQLSDPSGQYEVTVFSDTLETARAHLETGAMVVLTVEATMEGEQLKLLARGAAPVDGVVADVGGQGLRVFYGAGFRPDHVTAVLDTARAVAKGKGRGPIYLCALTEDLGEIDLLIEESFPVSPQVKGAFRSLPGVIEVEEI
jgi:DNA polymerase-3 subunit alpha